MRPGRALWIGVLLAPALATMLLFVVWPLLGAFADAFYSFRGLAPDRFAGLTNFQDVLFAEPWRSTALQALRHNLVVFATLLVAQNGLAFLIAFALLHALPLHRLHRVIVFLPVLLSAVIVGALWKLLLHPLFGAVNAALALLGIEGRPWLGDAQTALGSIMLANGWHWAGFPALLFLAAMQRIPREVFEAARMDGAGAFMILRQIVWPLVAQATTIIFTLTFIGSFNWFELPYLMAGLAGSPGGATDVLGLFFYRTAFGSVSSGLQDFGHGSALAVLMFVFLAASSAVALRFLRRREIEI